MSLTRPYVSNSDNLIKTRAVVFLSEQDTETDKQTVRESVFMFRYLQFTILTTGKNVHTQILELQ